MKFGEAGKKIQRAGWNSKNQYVKLAMRISCVNMSGTVKIDHDALIPTTYGSLMQCIRLLQRLFSNCLRVFSMARFLRLIVDELQRCPKRVCRIDKPVWQ